MRKWIEICPSLGIGIAVALLLVVTSTVSAATIEVPAGGDLQAALDAAVGGDTILLAPGATYVGSFVLPVHAGTAYVTVRTGGSDALLPAPGTRMSPAYSPYLAKLKSPQVTPAVRTAAGSAYWRLELLEFLPNLKSMYDVIALGDGSSAQNTLARMPHHLVLDRLYVHGDALIGQKRGIALNSGETTITNSYIADIKYSGQDSQAIGGWNGAGPYDIANNYLEATGNGFMIGGDDPKIPNLTPSDIVFRNNVVRRPVSWRDPIVPTPGNVRAATGNSGALPAGTYGYRIMARRNLLTVTANAVLTTDVTATVTDGGQVTLTWDPIPDATDYIVYGRTPGKQTMYWKVTGTTFVDGGQAGSAGTPSYGPTYWTVKNLFELKNAKRVQIEYNVFENNWAQAQNGFAVLFTPRNQYGGCTWCVLEDITFQHNIVRHSGGMLNITGYDDEHVSQQTKRVRVIDNEFADYGKTWGGTGYFLSIGNGADDVVVDHNTIISAPGVGLVVASGAPTTRFVFTNNVGMHDRYGIFGSGRGIGNPAITYYFPGAIVTRNAIAGASASEYPSGNLFPSVTSFAAHFTSYALGDYSLVPGTDWAAAGTDNEDLGANVTALHGVHSGATAALGVNTASLQSATEGTYYASTLEAAGGRAPYVWSLFAGTLPMGVQLDALTGDVVGAPVQAGDTAFTVQVQDALGASARQPLSLHVDAAIPPVTMTTLALMSPTATIPFSQALEAAGGTGAYVWSVSGGALPAGVTLGANGLLAGTASIKGTYSVTFTAADARDASRLATASFELVVQPKPNVAPTVSLASSASGKAPLASTVAFTASPVDVDGVITSVVLFMDGEPVATDTAAPYEFEWTAVAGEHRFSVLAVDDAEAAATSGEVTLTADAEIVLHAIDVRKIVGAYQKNPDAGAADGIGLWNPNLNAPKIYTAASEPVTYAEFQFYAEAGRPYHLWIRARAQKNEYANDSAYLQFSGVASAKIGTTDALIYQLEDAPTVGVSSWGWQDNGLGTAPGQVAEPIMFETTGLQTIRIQPREDGLQIDQIVVSPDRFLLTAPGGLKNDGTILAR